MCGNDLQTLLDFCGSPQNDAVERAMYKCFREHTGLTPKAYLKQISLRART